MRALRRSGRRFRVHRIDGLEMAVDVTDGTARLLHFYGQSCEPGLTRALRQRLAPGDVFLDIGATIGFFPVLAGHRRGRRDVSSRSSRIPRRAAILCETSAGSEADRFLREEGYEVGALDAYRAAFGNYCYERRTTDPAAASARSARG